MNIDVTVNQVYKKYLKCEKRYQLYFGGSSSGKSFFLAQRTILDMLTGDHNYLVVRNTQNTIKKSVFNEIIKAVNAMNLTQYFKVNKSDLYITCLLNNMQIIFAGLDDPEKIKSITPTKGIITDIWCEEATEMEYQAFKQLDKRLRGESAVKKRIVLSFNPVLKSHWIFQEFFKDWIDSPTTTHYSTSTTSILKTTYKDNDFLTDDDRLSLENEPDRYYYEVYSLGNWGVLGSIIFKNWTVEPLHTIQSTFDNYKNACDFGFSSDPAAVIRTHYDKLHKTIYVVDEIYMTDLTNDILASLIKKLIRTEYITCDSSEPKSVKELRNHGVNATSAKKGRDSVNHGIQWLQQQKIIVDPKCRNFINELQQYRWKEDKDGNALPVPIDKHNHLIDALRYAYEDESKGSRRIVLNRVNFI